MNTYTFWDPSPPAHQLTVQVEKLWSFSGRTWSIPDWEATPRTPEAGASLSSFIWDFYRVFLLEFSLVKK